jgi:hypothetical protein
MHIECPHCKESNEVAVGEYIHCHKCEKNFKGFSFRQYKKPLMGTGVALFLGISGALKVDAHFFEPKRYSTGAIYQIISSCANPDSYLLTSAKRERLAAACICALDKTMQKIDAQDLSAKAKEFKELFSANIGSCRQAESW